MLWSMLLLFGHKHKKVFFGGAFFLFFFFLILLSLVLCLFYHGLLLSQDFHCNFKQFRDSLGKSNLYNCCFLNSFFFKYCRMFVLIMWCIMKKKIKRLTSFVLTLAAFLCISPYLNFAYTFWDGLPSGWLYTIFFVCVCVWVFLTIAHTQNLTQSGHKNQLGSGLNSILLPSYGLDSGLVWLLGKGLCRLTSETGARAKQRSDPRRSGHRCGARMNTLNVLQEISFLFTT